MSETKVIPEPSDADLDMAQDCARILQDKCGNLRPSPPWENSHVKSRDCCFSQNLELVAECISEYIRSARAEGFTNGQLTMRENAALACEKERDDFAGSGYIAAKGCADAIRCLPVEE